MRRSCCFTLRQLFVLPAVVLLFLTLHKLPMKSLNATFVFEESLTVVGLCGTLLGSFHKRLGVTPNYALILALLYAPPVVSVARWGAAIVTARWRAVGIGCSAWLLATALTAAALIGYDLHERPWLDDEYYSPIGWWLIFGNGLFVASWLAVFAAPLKWLAALRRSRSS